MPKLQLTFWQKVLDVFYDVSAAVLSIVDVITDVLIAIDFYQNKEKRVYFWVAIVIFFLAQFCYTSLFCLAYASDLKSKYMALTFILTLPIAQLVPSFLWLDSYGFWVTRGPLRYFGMDDDALTSTKECPPDKDELQFWLEQKFVSHGGFLIESAIEAFPQSILQMIAVVSFQEADPLSVASIVLSMTSVASKALMFSYSIDRVTFFFNFFCMVTDVFLVFTTLAWVFYVPEKLLDDSDTPNFAKLDNFTVAGRIWIYKIFIGFGLCIGGGILFAFGMLSGAIWTEAFQRPNAPTCVSLCKALCRCCDHHNNGRGQGPAQPQASRSFSVSIRECRANCLLCCIASRLSCVRFCKNNCGKQSRSECYRCCKKECCDWKNFKSNVAGVMLAFIAMIALMIFMCMVPLAGIFLFCIFLMGVEIVKLSVIPLVFRGMNSRHEGQVQFYQPLFDFVLNTAKSQDDYVLRLGVANYTLLWNHWADGNRVLGRKFLEFGLKESMRQGGFRYRIKGIPRALTSRGLDDYNEMPQRLGPYTAEDLQTFIGNVNAWDVRKDWAKYILIPHKFLHESKRKALAKERKEMIDEIRRVQGEEAAAAATAAELAAVGISDDEKHYPDADDDAGVDLFAGLPDPASLSAPELDDPSDWSHLWEFHPRIMRKFAKQEWQELFWLYFGGGFKQVRDELGIEFLQTSGLGKCIFVFSALCAVLCLYVIAPAFFLTALLSLLYPPMATLVTWCLHGWAAVHFLQLTLTAIYTCVLFALLCMLPRVIKFQHCSYHLFPANRYMRKNSMVLQQIHEMKCRYIDLFASKARDEMMGQFFGDFSQEVLQFFPRMHYVEKLNLKVYEEAYMDRMVAAADSFDTAIEAHILDYAQQTSKVKYD